MRKPCLFVGPILAALLLQSCVSQRLPLQQEIALISPSGSSVHVQVEIATTPEELERGLMYRYRLDPGAGMLFVFDQPKEARFWMKNTLMPLDIVYFDADGNFISSTTMQPCKADPCVEYPSEGLASYALEVSEGFVKQNSVGSGWKFKGL